MSRWWADVLGQKADPGSALGFGQDLDSHHERGRLNHLHESGLSVVVHTVYAAWESVLISRQMNCCPGYDFLVDPATGNADTDWNAIATQLYKAANAGQGRVLLQSTKPTIPYSLNAPLPPINLPTISLLGPGISQCELKPTSALTGSCLEFQMSPFTTDSCGALYGFTVNGSDAAAGAVGLHYGDAIQGLIGLYVRNFDKAGSKGIWMDNRTDWTERTIFAPESRITNNTIGVLWDQNGGTYSHLYQQVLGLFIENRDGQVACQFQNGVHFGNGILNIRGNTGEHGGGSTVLKVMDTSLVGWTDGGVEFSIGVERFAGSPTGINLAAGSFLCGSGIIDFGVNTINSTRAPGSQIYFSGWFNCPGIAESIGAPL